MKTINYIFDFGNVIGEFYPEKLTAPFVQDEDLKKFVSEVAFDRLYWDRLDSGDITDEEIKADIQRRIPGDVGELACKVYDNWINTMTPVKNIQKLIFDIHKSGKRLYLLSNISAEFGRDYKKVKWIKELFDCFDGLVFSGAIGMVKPNIDIFEYILNRYNLNPGECLFIDDRKENIDVAKKIGIESYLFDGDAEKLRSYLEL